MRSYRSLLVVGMVWLLALVLASTAMAAQPKGLLIKPEKPEFQVEIWTDRGKNDAEYRVGENVRLYLRTTADAYVNVYSIMPDGKVELIFPNSFQKDNYVLAGETKLIPSGGYRLQVTGPSGTEYIQAVATKASLVLPREWFGSDADSVRRLVQDRLHWMGQRWCTDYASIRIMDGWSRWNRKSKVQINSYQSDVQLYVDGTYFGTLPQTVELDTGSHQLVALKEGYRVAVRDLNLSSGENENWNVRLEPIEERRFH